MVYSTVVWFSLKSNTKVYSDLVQTGVESCSLLVVVVNLVV